MKQIRRYFQTSAAAIFIASACTVGHAATAVETAVRQSGFNLAKAYSDIAAAEYDLRWQDQVGTFQAPNRANNLRFTFYANGFTAQPRDPRLPNGLDRDWKVGFTLESYGVMNPISPLLAPTVTTEKNEATLSLDELDVNYTNETNGLHQTFLVKRKPVVGPLTIKLAMRLDSVQMEWDEANAAVVFRDLVSHEEVMRYTGLYVFDATGRELPSRMEISAPNYIILGVDDSDAVYPVLVDPWTLHTPIFNGDTPQAGAQFGSSLAYYERRSGSTYFGSVIVGAPYFDGGQTDEGKVFGYLSDGLGIPSAANWTKESDSAYANFGNSLAVAQPYDPQDNTIATFQSEAVDFADLVVGAHNYNNGAGRVYVFYGNSSGINTTADRTYTGTTGNGGHFGYSVAAGDATGDGFQDLFIGQPYAGGNSDSGIVYIYKGSTTGLSTTSTSVSGEANGNLFGYSVAFGGGVRDSTFGDVIIGAPGYNVGRGKVYLFHGNSTGLESSAVWSSAGTQNSAQLGASVCGNVDVDSNAKKDIIAGEPFYDYDASTLDSGRVLVFRVDSSGNPMTPDILDGGHQAGARFGSAVAVGPINRNAETIGDIIVGAPRWDLNANDDKGRIFIYWGLSGQAPNPTPDNLDSGQSTLTGEYFGSSVLWIRKVTDPAELPCVAGGAPRATQNSLANAGIMCLYAYGP